MKTALHLFLCTLLSALVLLGCSGPAGTQKYEEKGLNPLGKEAGSAAHGGVAQPTAQVSSGENYGEEVSRLVYEKDEIVSVLKNGMVVIAKRVPSPAVAVRGYVMAGGVYEGQWLGGGLSHLLEHLVAGGTNDRRTEEQNRNLLQQIGNNSNAYTTNDHTAYFVNTTPENVDAAVDLVAGWMLGAKITPAEYAREYEVVQRELEKDMGEPDWVFYYLTVRNRYQVSPMRVPTIGYKEVIQGLSRDDVYAYYKKAYQPNNMVFAVAGNLEPQRMLEAVAKNVASNPPGRAFGHDIEEEPAVTAPRTVVATFPKLGQAKLELAFPSIRLVNPDLYALDLLATILGRGESSILIEEIRDKRGLVSGIAAMDNTPQFVDGAFEIDMELPTEKMGEATSAVLEELEKIKKEGVSEERLARAKTQTKTARAFATQTAEAVAASLATDFMATGDIHFSDRYVERSEKVTAQQIKEVANRYFDRQKLLTTAMVPEEAVGKDAFAGAEKLIRPIAPTTQESKTAVAANKVSRVDLEDGTTLLLRRVDTSPVVVMRLYSLGGLTAEDAKTNGMGNLAMSLISRGTKTRSAQEIAQFFDSIGGDLSATSGNNSWNWSATCLKDDLGKTLEVFADVVRNPIFPDNEVTAMKRRVVAAIESQDADWFAASMRFFRKTYFGPMNSPYQFMTIGTKENVAGFTPEQIRQYYSGKIIKPRRVLAVYGDIDIEKARGAVEKSFGKVGGGGANKSGGTIGQNNASAAGPPMPSINVKQVKINKSPNPQTGVLIGFNSRSVVGEADNFPLTVADNMCSGYGYPTGYIFEILRGRGLVYDANAMVFPGRSAEHPGAFLAYAGCDAKNADACIDVILENIARLQGTAEDMQPDWFERSKKLITTADALNNQTAAEQAQTAALDELFGLGFDYHEHFAERINAVHISDVQRVAKLRLNECIITVTTDNPEMVKAKEGVRTYAKFPPVDLTPKGVGHDAK
jgi:zinc protease